MESLNVPVPPAVDRLAAQVAPELTGLERRDPYTLLVKRLSHGGPDTEKRVRRALADVSPFTVRVDGIDVFREPTAGSAPVVYFTVDSPGLWAVHERLCDVIEPLPELEGEDYTPHVTLARGSDGSIGGPDPREVAARLAGRDVGPVEWTARELTFWERETPGATAGRIPLSP